MVNKEATAARIDTILKNCRMAPVIAQSQANDAAIIRALHATGQDAWTRTEVLREIKARGLRPFKTLDWLCRNYLSYDGATQQFRLTEYGREVAASK
jgi:hypothetical protein